MRTYVNGDRPHGVDIFGKVTNHEMTRIYFRGTEMVVTKLKDRLALEGVHTEVTDGWESVNFSLIEDGRVQFSVATIVMLDDFRSLEIATNEN